MLGWERDISGRLQRTTEESQPNMEDTEESNNHNNRPRPPMQDQRIVREFLNPPRLSTPSCFMLPPNHGHVTIRPQVVSQLPIFRGTENENPYSHIKEFEDIISNFQEANTSLDIFCMKLFPLSLKNKAKTWLNNLINLIASEIGVIYNQCFYKNAFQHIGQVHWKKRSQISRL